MSKKTRASLLLILTALIWGLAFVAQDVAMDSVRAFTFNGARMLLAAVMLLVVCLVLDKRKTQQQKQEERSPQSIKTLLLGGVVCGVVLALASSLQQVGLEKGASAGKAGFITAMYIVLVPVCGVFIGKKLRLALAGAVVLSTLGLYLLCITGKFSLASSDIYLILCAVAYTAHILVVDYFSPKVDCVKLSAVQFFVSAVVCITLAQLLESPDWSRLKNCLIPLLYAGFLSGGVAYTLQMVAQKDLEPTVASLIMCLESVFAVLGGLVILGDVMTLREYLGCGLMLCGILLAQSPERKKAEKQ